jgi:hypothetical protein
VKFRRTRRATTEKVTAQARTTHHHRHHFQEVLLYAGVGLMGLLVFYRAVVLSNGDLVPTEVIDGRFNLAVLEHWLRALRGFESLGSPNWFYPVPGILGYSDMLVLFTPPYILSRVVGLDPFSAFQVTTVAVSAVGYLGALWFFRQVLSLHPVAAASGAYIFAFHFWFVCSMGHPQMLTAQFVPYVAGFSVRYFANPTSSGGMRNGMALAVSVPLVASTSYYVGYFTVLVLGIAVVLLAVGMVPGGMRAQWALLKDNWSAWLILACVGGLASLPLLLTYVPVMPKQAYVGFADALAFLPSPVTQFLGPVNLTFFAAGLVVAIRDCRRYRRSFNRAVADQRKLRALVSLVLSLTVLIAWALVFHSGRRTLWYYAFMYMPGASVLRDVRRINQVLKFAVVAVGTIALSEACRACDKLPRRGRVAGYAALIAIVALNGYEQLWSTYTFSKSAQIAMLDAVPDPPRLCVAFYVIEDPATQEDPREIQMDAVMIAQAKNLPTLNGYSARSPDGWLLNNPPDRAAYQAQAAAWAKRYGVRDGLCALDRATNRWTFVSS